MHADFQSAIQHYHAGDLPQAELTLKTLQNNPDALHLLGLIYYRTGRHEAALASINSAIQLNPSNADYYSTMGLAHAALNQPEQVLSNFQKAVALKPDCALAHNNLATAFRDRGNPQEAITNYQLAIALKPDYVLAHNNLGGVYHAQGRLDAAAISFRNALALAPNLAITHNNLGNISRAQGKLHEAIAYHRSALALQPDLVEGHNNLGNALKDQGEFTEAVACYQTAITLNPALAEIHNNLGNAFFCMSKLTEAIDCFLKARALDDRLPVVHNNLGVARNAQGKHDEAMDCYRLALALKPDYAEAHSNLLFGLQYEAHLSRSELLAAHRQFAELFETPFKSQWPIHQNNPDAQKRLKVGYISADFRRHPVASFIEPVLRCHDKAAVEIFCYYSNALHDAITERFESLADHWIPAAGFSDEQLCARIRDDGIDLLVDLSGHTSGNRLQAFARKPAPVQMTYLGYPGTTGLSAMDYRITDSCADTEDSDQYYSEKLLRLPHSLWCYHPASNFPNVTPLPALKNGYLTFGSFNNFNKIDSASIALWAELLRSLPSSRLLMVTVPEGEPRARLIDQFAILGIKPEQLELHKPFPAQEFLHMMQRVDVMLDPLLTNGATTTAESLWMGVPVISMIGTRFLARAGYSISSAAGMTEFIAQTPEDYIKIGMGLANKIPQLATLRTELRTLLAVSPLMDVTLFTRNLEHAYRDAWKQWCEKNSQA